MIRLAFAAAALAAMTASPIAAQNAGLAPNAGSITLRTGFTPDPREVRVTAGGTIDGNALPGACTGMISDAPDYRVTFTAGSLPLAFRTNSSADTTLIVNDPSGHWACDDDSNGSDNAKVVFDHPQSGVYDVWVGVYGTTATTAAATLQITELETVASSSTSSTSSRGASTPNPSLAPNSGSTVLRTGFTPDPRQVQVTAGGTVDGSHLPGSCSGMISEAPDYRVTFTPGSLPLAFRTVSSADTTLIINDPNGNWVCDDDSNGNTNAKVVFQKPAAGVYDVWVGVFGSTATSAPATLQITELP